MREYLAEERELEEEVLKLAEQWNGGNGNSLRRKLNRLIREDPHLLAAYHLRYVILEDEDYIVAALKEAKRAYKAVCEMIADEEGHFPDKIDWARTPNRSVLQALHDYAEFLWKKSRREEGKAFILKILAMNPADNCGSRFIYLALCEKIAYTPFQERFKGDRAAILEWFRENCHRYETLETWG
ncbi:MAG: hypothetical protein GY801_50615 [bacterium]|nr:hypothetical protein [bacterium]